MNSATHLVVLRSDDVRGTILRRRPDTSQLSDVWVDGRPEVVNGDVVAVLRINAEGENGFSYIRVTTVDGFAEGFIRSCYLTLRPLHAIVAALAAVHRGGFGPTKLTWHLSCDTRQETANRSLCCAVALIFPGMTMCGLKADTASKTAILFKFYDKMLRASMGSPGFELQTVTKDSFDPMCYASGQRPAQS
jgi:hypothetical protein